MTEDRDTGRGGGNTRTRWRAAGAKAAVLIAGAAVLVTAILAAGCSRQPPSGKSLIRTTKAFDSIFGELPPIDVPGPCDATVAYFPSAREPGTFRPAPIFSAEQGKAEWLSVRTVIRGLASAGNFSAEIVSPFPPGSDLDALSIEGGVATVRVGGAFRTAGFPAERRDAAARALALTVAQFGKAREVDVTDAAGTAHFRGTADASAVADVGPPEVLGLLAIKEKMDRPATVLSVLFDRPVFVEDVALLAPGANVPVAGKIYATGFGMTAELHPGRAVSLNTGDAWRVRVTVRDGKGRRTSEDRSWIPKEVTRD